MNATVKFKLDQTNRSPSSRATCFVAVGEIRSGCIVALQTEPVALKMYWRLIEDPWLSLEDQASAKARLSEYTTEKRMQQSTKETCNGKAANATTKANSHSICYSELGSTGWYVCIRRFEAECQNERSLGHVAKQHRA